MRNDPRNEARRAAKQAKKAELVNARKSLDSATALLASGDLGAAVSAANTAQKAIKRAMAAGAAQDEAEVRTAEELAR